VCSRDVVADRVVCDGCDGPRALEERCREPSLWLLTEGAFELRDRRGRRTVDPSLALALAADDPFSIRHHAGADVCIAVRGPLVSALVGDGSRAIPISAGDHARIAGAVRADDVLALAEAIAALVPDPAPPRPRRDRDLVAALEEALRRSFAEPSSLSELASATGTSVFHACRVFRRVTGSTLHGFRRELRLRHALAMLVDGDAPLADVAAATGFASQSHLTNLFRARFAITPGRVRATRAIRTIRHQRAPLP
jgi:AraC-like DNA-binding protein